MPGAVNLARAHRKGHDFELSGEEVYNGIALPLHKAYRRLEELLEPSPNQLFYPATSILPVAVINGPLLGAKTSEDGVEVEPIPWARIIRLEPQIETRFFSGEHWFFDVVQASHFSEYLDLALAANVSVIGLAKNDKREADLRAARSTAIARHLDELVNSFLSTKILGENAQLS